MKKTKVVLSILSASVLFGCKSTPDTPIQNTQSHATLTPEKQVFLDHMTGNYEEINLLEYDRLVKVAESGNPHAQNQLWWALQVGTLVYKGEPIKLDYERAYNNLKSSADAGHPKSKLELALIHLSQDSNYSKELASDDEANTSIYVKYVKSAADMGYPDAQWQYASELSSNQSIRNDKLSFNYNKMTTENEYSNNQQKAMAYKSLSLAYQSGNNFLEMDIEKARKSLSDCVESTQDAICEMLLRNITAQ